MYQYGDSGQKFKQIKQTIGTMPISPVAILHGKEAPEKFRIQTKKYVYHILQCSAKVYGQLLHT